jgi:hypothetical protein
MKLEARGIVVEVANVHEYDSDLERDVTRPYPVVEFVTAREQVVPSWIPGTTFGRWASCSCRQGFRSWSSTR